MSDDLESYFAAERAFEEVPGPDVRRRIHDGVFANVPPPPPPGGGLPMRHAALGMLGTFALGGVLGAAVMRAASPSAPIVAHAPVVISVPSSLPPPSENVPSLPVSELSSVAPPAPRAPSPSVSAESIAAERALLDAARVALANGEAEAALDRAMRHATEFPRGRLSEEREAIAVRSLVKLGRYAEARQRGAAFEARWPRSLALPAVHAALETIP